MSLVCLHLQQADGHLPMVCMRCGAPATVVETRIMKWYPFMASFYERKARLCAPLCAPHRNHWTKRTVATWIAGICIAGFFVGTIFATDRIHGSIFTLTDATAFGFCIAIVTAIVAIERSAIRPREITRTHILLSGVCEAFVDAVENAEIEHRVRLRQWEIQDGQDGSRVVRADGLNADTHGPRTAEAIERGGVRRAPPTDAIQE